MIFSKNIKLIHLIALMSFILVFSNTVFSQKLELEKHSCQCFIKGRVVDELSQQPIVGAVIHLKELRKGTLTDKNGYYQISNICEGKYTILAKIVGYQEKKSLINLKHEDATEHDFKLDENEIHLDLIQIKAKKNQHLTQEKSFLEGQQLDQTRGQTLGESLKQISGLTTLQTGTSVSKPVIHGMHSNRVLIMNNGVRQEGQQWGSEHAPEIDPFVAQKITVLKGASGVRYGADAIAGVIILEPNPLPDSNKISGEWNNIYFTNGRQWVSSALIENGYKRAKNSEIPFTLGMRVQGTYKKGGNVFTPKYNLANTGMNEFNYSLSANYKRKTWLSEIFFSQFSTQIGIFSGSHIGNTSDLTIALQQNKPQAIYTPDEFTYAIDRPLQDVQHYLLKLKNVKNFSKSKLSFNFSHQYNFRQEVDKLRGSKDLIQLFKLRTYTSEVVLEHQPIARLFSGMIGVSGLYQENITSGTFEKPTSSTVLIPNFRNLTGGIFLIERIVKNKWEAELGIRYDNRNLEANFIPKGQQNIVNNIQFNDNITGTFGANYRPNSQWNFIANVSSAWRAATVNEMFSDGVHHGAASYEKGDPNLMSESAINTNFTINFISKAFQFEIHSYLNYIKNYIFLAPTGKATLSIRGAFPSFVYTQTNANFQGFDFNSSLRLHKNFNFISKLSYLKAQDLTNNQPIFLIPANRIENTLQFNQNRSQFAISHQFVAKQNNIPNKLFFTNIPPSEIVFDKFGGDYADSPPAYDLWSISVGHSFVFSNRKSLDISCTVTNLLNVSYRDYLNRFRYFTDEMGQNFAFRTKFSL